MLSDDIPRKTPKGLAELETRAHRLAPKLRQALVRVDGAKPLEVLVAEAGAMGEALEVQLAELLAEGFIVANVEPDARATASAPAAAGPAPVPPRAPDERFSRTLPLAVDPQLQRVTELKEGLRPLLGAALEDAASPLYARLAGCSTVAELDGLVDDAFILIQDASGKPQASHFFREAKALLKSAP